MSDQPQQLEFESIVGEYPVHLENFDGPLDLLLHLIRKHELNIYDIPIALVTRQYLDYLDLMQELDLDVVGEFLVMAATLIHIKSRTAAAARRSRRRTMPKRIRARRSCGACSSTSDSRPRPSCCTRRKSSAAPSGAGPTAASPRWWARRPSRRSRWISSA